MRTLPLLPPGFNVSGVIFTAESYAVTASSSLCNSHKTFTLIIPGFWRQRGPFDRFIEGFNRGFVSTEFLEGGTFSVPAFLPLD